VWRFIVFFLLENIKQQLQYIGTKYFLNNPITGAQAPTTIFSLVK